MEFSFKITIPGGASYEEEIDIPDQKAYRLLADYELDEYLDDKLKKWVSDNIEYEWEKVYGRD